MTMDKTRIDKWLWAARFFKTRSLATEAVNKGQVQMSGKDIKPAHDVRVGDTLVVSLGPISRTVKVLGISEQRGSATIAQQLYLETEESQKKRAQAAEQRRLSPEPARTIEHGRPTKRDRRDLQKAWDSRWTAKLDD